MLGKLVGSGPKEFQMALAGYGWRWRADPGKPELEDKIDLMMLNTRFLPLVFHSTEKATDYSVLQRKLSLEFSREAIGSLLSEIDVATRKKRVGSANAMRKQHVSIYEADSSRKTLDIAHLLPRV